jgi:hypothetical protein
MPDIRQYPQATSLLPSDAFVIDRLGIGTMYITADDLVAVYDIAMGYPSPPLPSATILAFVAVRPVILGSIAPEVQSRAAAITAPSGGASVLTLNQNGTPIATITFASGSNVGVVAFTAPVTLAPGDVVSVTTGLSTYGLANIAITLAGLV